MKLRLAASLPFLWLSACSDKDPREAVAAALPVPGSARFQSVRDRDDHICGEVNSREGQGGYSGYKRFVYDKQSDAVLIDPGEDRIVPAGPPDPACAKPFAYQSVEERLNCAAAPAPQSGSDRQRAFDELWRRACE